MGSDSGADSTRSNTEPSTSVRDSGLLVQDLELFQNLECQAETSLSIETLHLFSPPTFQHLLSSMASRICGELPDGTGDVVQFRQQRHLPPPEPKSQKGKAPAAETKTAQLHRSSGGDGRIIPKPGNFIIDPLHFLGITPTTQSSELLKACKLISV
jgi:hypothetical protein